MNIPAVSSANQAAMVAVLQEAMETAAQTRTEAAKGDPQAMMKLARLQAEQAEIKTTAAVPPEGTGNVVNVQR